MSLTPTTPSFQQTVRSFWSRPEGTTGKLFLTLGAIGIGTALFIGWGAILPFILGVLGNTIELMGMCALIAFAGFLVTNPKIHLLVKNCFQLSMRWATGLVIEIDPIGILRNYIDEMKKKKLELDETTKNVAGVKQSLLTNIQGKKDDMAHQMSLIEETQRQVLNYTNQLKALNPNDPRYTDISLKISGYNLKTNTYKQKVGFELDAVKKLQNLLDTTTKLYTNLSRYGQLADYKIETTTQQVDLLAEQRKMILESSKALNAATRLLKGDPAELAMVDQTLDFLADSTAKTLGDMDDFDRWSQSYLDNMDIEKGAAANDATKKLAEFEAKLTAPQLGPGNSFPVINMIPDNTGTYVPATTSTTNAYEDMFK